MFGRLRRALSELRLSDYDAGMRDINARFTAGYLTEEDLDNLRRRGDAAMKRLCKKFQPAPDKPEGAE